MISVDADAEALTYYCRFCENTVAIRDDAVGWFANAIMAGYDTANHRQSARREK